MNKYKLSIVTVLLPILLGFEMKASLAKSFQIGNNQNKAESCTALLGAGMYNKILEELCNFNGGVKDKILTIYDQNGCREIIPQAVVDKTAKDVLIDTKRRYKTMGHVAFCDGNIDHYNSLAD